jgi:beta-N-acetylhexosaminidase
MVRPDLPIGELFLLGFENTGIGLLEEFHDHFGLAGVIVFGRNFESPSELKEIIDESKARTANNLIVAVDQEGGDVARLSGSGFPTFPSPAYYGERGELQAAVHAARVTSKKLNEVGINMNLGPVADVLTNPDNVLMKRRSYSSDVAEVCRFVLSIVGAQSEFGVASCAKHFPGLGDASIDPHREAAVSEQAAVFFEKNMFPPFAAAVEGGVSAIMTTHLFVPSLDPVHMATFSRRICDEILRESIGFEGVIITDDLNMHAVDDAKEAVPKALSAGHDIVLVGTSFDEQLSFAGRLWESVESGKIPRRAISQKIERVKQLKTRFEILT